MDSGGGFMIPSMVSELNQNEGGASSSSVDQTNKIQQHEEEEPLEVRRLTQKQEIRLMNYLDDQFQQIVRGYAKRYTATNLSQIPTISLYLEKMESILHIIIGIPPVGPSLQLLLNYLLRFTNEILDGIPGYELDRDQERVDQISQNLEKVVESLDLLDRIWSSILRGKMIDWQNAKENVKRGIKSNSNVLSFPPNIGTPLPTSSSDSITAAINNEGRYPALPSSKPHNSDNHSIVGSRGYSTVGQTQRIRLRNVIILAKENLFSWMRTQLDAPLPPQIQNNEKEIEEETSEIINREGDLEDEERENLTNKVEQKDVEDEERDVQLEDVETNNRDNLNPKENEPSSNEHNHYDNLFAKQIDPDAEDDEEEEERDGNDDKADRKRSNLSPEEDISNKRIHIDQSTTNTTFSPSKAESQATLKGISGPNAVAVMRWDVAFARLFQKTLRCLSDIQDRSERQTAGGIGGASSKNSLEKELS